jgi:hypothetical protein
VRAIDRGSEKSKSAYLRRLAGRSGTKLHRAASPIGRWSLFPAHTPFAESRPLALQGSAAQSASNVALGELAMEGLPGSRPSQREGTTRAERWCKLLLARYGVVFRDLLAREASAPPWWELVRVLRRMELRGEVRGGRFIHGVGGEQFAVESAVSRLRDLRDKAECNGQAGSWVLVSAADPLNLAGILTTGPRIPATHKSALVIQNGRCVAAKIAGRIEFFAEVDPREHLAIRKSLQVGSKVRPVVLAEAPAEPHLSRAAAANRQHDPTQLHSRRRFGF